MNLHLKKITALLCIFFLLFTNYSVLAKKDDTPLYEIYPYAEDYEYGDEILPHALKAAVPKIFLKLNATLSHDSVEFNKSQLNEDLDYIYSEYSAIPEDELNAMILKYLHDNVTSYIIFGAKKRTDIEAAAEGSGVVVSEDGYIATNAHVINMDEETKKELYASKITEVVLDDMVEIFTYLEGLGVTFTDDEKNDLFYEIVGAVALRTSVVDEETALEVYFPNAKGETNPASATIYEADVIEEGESSGVTVEGLTQDTAIIKIDAENLVALKLSETYPELNSTLISAGYPVASDYVFRMSGSDEATLSVTVGNGTVSRHVPISGSKYQAIEVNLTISGGNSGGPSVDKHLHIEGLNTYINAQDNRYAYMIPAEYVSVLLEDHSPSQGEVSKTFLLGLQMLQQGYGETATECFERVEELQPDTPYIKKIIEIAKAAPKEAYPVNGASNFPIPIHIIIIIAVSLVVVIGIIILIVVLVKKSKKTPRPAVHPATPAPAARRTLTPTPVSRPGAPPTGRPVTPAPPVHTPTHIPPTPVHRPTPTPPPAPSSSAPTPTVRVNMSSTPTSSPSKPRNEFFKNPDDL